VNVKATGATVTFSVTASADCKWSVSTGTSWITLETRSGSGTTNGTFVVTVNSGASRSGSVNVGGLSIAVTQDAAAPPPPTCVLSLSPTSLSIPIEGGSSSFKVSVEAGCAWSVDRAPSWVALRLKSGTGASDVGFAVAQNPGAPRSDVITVSGQTIKISQAGGSVIGAIAK
jgi:hypothetical protein